ncbi:MAG: FtsX-like permease family protein [Gemmatimonadetes bacterium]|nr:FtsX-like permease family protein [Gemmatimonadota bacterium]NIR78724.1 FtsX-like permease family protein [Gemmatimonadota bacterium]NIT87363.1 FtsX-like permease family protein [Gemmatimonadota bacterium]NIU31207.1 FtsX-like permease family protein [Gemmatimonadota bacterium]NIU35928.1 FtsX-like permease family protein [Gemmatimonadota bacterium]
MRSDALVAAAGIAGGLPPDRPAAFNNFDLLDQPVEPGGRQPVSPWTPVDAGFFEALELTLLEGRLFRPDDDGAAPPVVVVTRSWAERHYPGESAVGREMVSGGCTSCPPTTVVGVVEDVSYRGLDGSQDAVFVPFRQWPLRTMHLLVRSRGPAAVGLRGVREAIRAIDPGLPLTDATTLEDRLYAATARPRHWGLLLGAFAAAAVALASVGIFGVLSYAVRRREREIGVRLAMGARAGSLVALVVGRGMRRAGLGVLLGLGLALGTNRWLEGLLFGIAPTDPETLAGVSALLLGVALLACWLPARRATRVDPVKTMSAA